MRNRTRVRVSRWPVPGRAERWSATVNGRRIIRRTMFGIALLAAVVINWAQRDILRSAIGFDHATYMAAADRWLGGDGFYLGYQLTGPYLVVAHEILYPPTILLFLVVAHLLPAILWWAIPTAIVLGVIVYWRPSAWGWAGIFACFACPTTMNIWANGNPGIWAVAAVATATIWGWPGVLVLLKPSLFPFALVGIRSRGWWIAASALMLLSLVFLPMWADYATALVNARGSRVSLLYSAGNVPLVCIPLIAWLARRSAHRSAAIVETPKNGM